MSKQKPVKIIICGGGTGGHIFPAIAIANKLKEMYQENIRILFIGAKNRMEMVKVPQAGYKIRGLWISGWKRGRIFTNLLFPIKLVFSIIKSFFIIRQYHPNVVVGVGGYSSGPPVWVASKMNIPTLIQEQNSYAGLTTRLLSKYVDKICLAYEEAKQYLYNGKTTITGNPVRQSILNVNQYKEVSSKERQKLYDHFGLDLSKKTILVIGGSLGAKTLNLAFKEELKSLKEQKDNIQVLWQCGQLYIYDMKRYVDYIDVPNVFPREFINRMDYAYAIADLIISRAGAIAISEICVAGKPTILVPSPNVAEDHQTKNAMTLVNKNAAELITDEEAVPKLVPKALELLNDQKKLNNLTKNIQQLGYTDADERIANEIKQLIDK